MPVIDTNNEQSAAETCVLNRDGTMEIYEPYSVDAQELIRKGAYQSWGFGPSLLDESGKAKQEFSTWDYLRQAHPRTAIGYYEPGHYCFLVADGRQEESRGMFLEEMADLFEKLGCKAAYNLDGGHSSFMTMQDQVVSHPYDPSQEVMDGIFYFREQVKCILRWRCVDENFKRVSVAYLCRMQFCMYFCRSIGLV